MPNPLITARKPRPRNPPLLPLNPYLDMAIAILFIILVTAITLKILTM